MNPLENSWEPAATPTPVPVSPPVAGQADLPAGLGAKNPILAAFLSAFPGLGNIYNGLYLRGLVFFVIIGSLLNIIVRGHGLAGFALAFFWLFNMMDAYRQAALINYGYAQDLGLLDRPRHPAAGQAGLGAGILLVGIGLFALLDRYFSIDLDWLIDLWPVALLGLGAWLIWGSIRDRRRARMERGDA
ncbi:MAG TPA: DUF5668 domain-containing protein [Thermoanaerobaculia bacterium]|nr:DUF5668 domain-containing protein [Thermoanaerobaculia bacterium]